MRLALLPVVFLFLLPGYTYAQDVTGLTTADADVLKDVGPMVVFVDDLPRDFESLGLRRDDIQRDVELKLRLAGITIYDDDESGYLYVVIGGTCDRICGSSVRISYREQVFVLRGDEYIEVYSPATWETAGVVGIVGSDNLKRSIRDSVKDMVDEFVNAYLTANPKR